MKGAYNGEAGAVGELEMDALPPPPEENKEKGQLSAPNS